MRASLIRLVIWLVTAAAIVMMFWPLIREVAILITEPPLEDF